MDLFEREFNGLIVETFHHILREEMRFVTSLTNCDVSAREIHLIEEVGKAEGYATVGDIADALGITAASVTVMANKLEGEGYLLKRKDDLDARIVRISLTDKGHEIDKRHTEFHASMVRDITKGLTGFEREVLAGAVKKLNEFFLAK